MRKRILVANRPRLMRDLVATLIAQQPDLEVIGEVYDEKDLPAAVEALAPEVVVVGLGESDEIPPSCAMLLTKRPDLKILGVAAEKDSSTYFWAEIKVCSRPIENSERGLLEAIRAKKESLISFSISSSGKPN